MNTNFKAKHLVSEHDSGDYSSNKQLFTENSRFPVHSYTLYHFLTIPELLSDQWLGISTVFEIARSPPLLFLNTRCTIDGVTWDHTHLNYFSISVFLEVCHAFFFECKVVNCVTVASLGDKVYLELLYRPNMVSLIQVRLVM